jgi:pyrimidine-nucleoside phosphorylase
MTYNEIINLTKYMLESGEQLDLSSFEHVVDKHSTGGVGDKTSLIALPLASSCGINVIKMSGRGLGHTGGTVDKLESIPNFKITEFCK